MSQNEGTITEILASEFVLKLLGEYEPDVVVWRTMNMPYTASELIELIRAKDPSGMSYVSHLMRVAREAVKIQAQRELESFKNPEQIS